MSRQRTSSDSPPLRTSYEVEGYDGIRNGVRWWFAAWGSGPKEQWRQRELVGRPPTPGELAIAKRIVIGFDRGTSAPDYRTFNGGLDL